LLAISKVDRGSDADRVLQFGDLVTHMNSMRLSNRQHLESVFSKVSQTDSYEVSIICCCCEDWIFSEARDIHVQVELKVIRLVVSMPLKAERLPRGFEQVELKVIRLVVSMPLKAERLPRGFEQVAGYKYHIALLYLITGCKLALAIKSFNNKAGHFPFSFQLQLHSHKSMRAVSGH
uniref:PDZ_3 domain-containing protein n=1 Tax=Toxocara canis TaxID=6265 RepID=A0A183U7S6_TOXCA